MARPYSSPPVRENKSEPDRGGRGPDGFGKYTNAPDEVYIDVVVHPAQSREEASASHLDKSRTFRVTEKNVTGHPNNLFDDEGE